MLMLLFAAEVVLGLQWRLLQDTPLLHYIAWMATEHDYVIYRDVFETSMPGSFLVHIAIGLLFGYGDLAFRLVDTGWLLTLIAVSWSLIRRIDPTVAWASALGFAIAYIANGEGMAMQRDYLGLLPIVTAMLIASGTRYRPGTRAAIVGGLFAAAVALKPHLGIGLPVTLVYMAIGEQRVGQTTAGSLIKQIVQTSLYAAGGFVLILALPLLWLWTTGGLGAFWEMTTRYLPLHVHMTGAIETVTPEQHFDYMVRKFIHGIRFYVPPAIVGVAVALGLGNLNHEQKRLVWLFACMAVAYSIYTALGGKFWLYHWIPFRFMATVCAALVLVPLLKPGRRQLMESILVVVFATTLTVWVTLYGYTKQSLRFPVSFGHQVRGLAKPPPKGGKVDEIAEFLIEANLGPDDRVQPLDWTEGAVHAMLIAEALPATPYIYDYYFYHYISDPYIQEIRGRYIAALQADLPRFMIDVTDKLKPSGLDTTDRFPELESIIAAHYQVVKEGTNYRILERMDSDH
jgi:hypothetical protein